MTEQQAKRARKLNQAVSDAIREMPDSYTIQDAASDILDLSIEDNNIPDQKKLSTKLIAGLLRWQVDNL